MSSVEINICVHDGDDKAQMVIRVKPEDVQGLSLGEWLMSVLDDASPSLITLDDTEVPIETPMLELCQKSLKPNLNVFPKTSNQSRSFD